MENIEKLDNLIKKNVKKIVDSERVYSSSYDDGKKSNSQVDALKEILHKYETKIGEIFPE